MSPLREGILAPRGGEDVNDSSKAGHQAQNPSKHKALGPLAFLKTVLG